MKTCECPNKLPENQQCLASREWGDIACLNCKDYARQEKREKLLNDIVAEVEYKRGFNL